VDSVEKRETGNGFGEETVPASRYCPGAGIKSAGQEIRA